MHRFFAERTDEHIAALLPEEEAHALKVLRMQANKPARAVNARRLKREPLTKLERSQLPMIYLFLLPTLVIFLLFYISPILTVFYTGFTSWNGFNPPEWTGIRNYARLSRAIHSVFR